MGIKRPDITAPSDPSLYKAQPTPEGIHLGWRFSSSNDVDRHELELTATGDLQNQQSWLTLEWIQQDYEDNGTIDSDSLLALVGLNVISVELYNELITQDDYEIYAFLGKLELELWNGDLQAEVTLDWEYENTDQLVDFQLFRSTENSALMLYKTLPADELASFTFTDEDILPGRRYFYKIMARHLGGGFSPRSKTLMVRVPKY